MRLRNTLKPIALYALLLASVFFAGAGCALNIENPGHIAVTQAAYFPETLEVTALAFSPDGKQLAAANAVDRPIHVWSLASGEIVRTLKKPGTADPTLFDQLRYSPDGRFLASIQGPPEVIAVWSAATGKLIKQITTNIGGGVGIAFTPDSRRLVAAFDRPPKQDYRGRKLDAYMLAVYDTATWRRIATFNAPRYFSPDELALSPNGRFVAVGGLRIVPQLLSRNPPMWKPVIAEVRILIIDLARLKVVRTIIVRAEHYSIRALVWSPDSRYIAYSAAPINKFKAFKAIKIWNAATGKLTATEIAFEDISAIGYTPDGRYFLDGGFNINGIDGKIRIWDAAHRRLLWSAQENTEALAVSRDSRLFAVGGPGYIRVWRLK
ncbi:MAG TPA: hypothetical protein DEP05_05905 [Betaproteobacteria bacterium]|nr:hypothetical protein [Betaproteobacteria bacterium]